MEIIERRAALALGLVRYFTGRPCRHGHVCSRYSASGCCIDCSKLAEKKHRESNAESYAALKRNRREKTKSRDNQRGREYKEKNKDQLREKRKIYNHKNKEEIAKKHKEYWARTREKRLSKMKEWRDENKGARSSLQAKRRSAKIMAIPSWFGEFDEFVWGEAARLVQLRRIATGLGWAADHMIPLRGKEVCGLHIGHNCQVIPSFLNNMKHNKMIMTEPDEWLSYL